MPHEEKSANGLSYEELESLFNDDDQQENDTPPAQDDGNSAPTDSKDVSQTKAFAKRLKESTDKVRSEEREAIAKQLGYDSYDELVKSKERKMYEDKGLDPDEVSPIVDELVQQKLDNDPRMKELAEFKAKQVEEFAKKELAEITKLTGGEITKLEQIPVEVIELWKTKGSLKKAYLELEGEKLITRARGEQSRGSTDHLATPTGSAPNTGNKRPLTAEERKAWKIFYPNMSEEELNKKFVDKE